MTSMSFRTATSWCLRPPLVVAERERSDVMDDIRFEQIARIDAQGKACGTTAYMSDLSFPGMLYAWFVRSKYPHALIKSVDISKAMALEGVVTVLTAADVTGFNGFGIVDPHTPLETESGVAVPEADGSLSMYAGSQYAFRDQLQLARILGMNPRMIHVYSNPVGGGFGGKDELTIQGGIALLAMKTGKPVKVFLSREELLDSGWKRHPFSVRMRTGFKSDGTMLANDVTCYEDKGAYSSLGGPILNLVLEHASSLYRVPNTRHEGWAVFTNNGVCGAFRGFGVPQVLFALESNMDEAAEKLGLDPVTIRRKHVLHQGEVSPIGHTLRTGVSMELVLDAIEKSDLWQHREEYKKADKPWLRRGVELALAPKGAGNGIGIPDYAGAYIDLDRDGNFTLRIGLVEYGQGTHTGFTQMAAGLLHVHPSRVRIVAGQTEGSVDASPASASRSMYTASNAIAAAFRDFGVKVAGALDAKYHTGAGVFCEAQDGGMPK